MRLVHLPLLDTPDIVRFVHIYAVNTHWTLDILELRLAEEVEADFKLANRGVVGSAGYAYTPWLCKALQARSNVHAVTVNVLTVDDHVTKVDANT